MTLRRKKGILVSRIGEPLSAKTVSKVMKQVRQERERSNLGTKSRGQEADYVVKWFRCFSLDCRFTWKRQQRFSDPDLRSK